MGSRMLVVGGSHSDMPLIESAQMYGLDVYTVSNAVNHPGHRVSTGYLNADYSNPDEILKAAKKINADYIIPGANDFAMLSAAYVAEQMKLPGLDNYDTTKMLHHKDKFKKLGKEIQIPLGGSKIFYGLDKISENDLRDLGGFPLIVKPVDLTGGKGMTKLESEEDINIAIKEALTLSRHHTFIVEEWFAGSLHSYSTVIENGEIIFEYFDTEACMFQPYLVSTSISICSVDQNVRTAVKESAQAVIKRLGLVNGVLHCQFMYDGTRIKILEYTRRMSGDLYSKVVQLVRGFRHADVFIAAVLGEKLSSVLDPSINGYEFVSRHCITSAENGIFQGIMVDQKIRPFVESVTPIVPIGTQVSDDGRSKVAVVILRFNSADEMISHYENFPSLFKCKVHS